jgi:hypothetical protein
MTTKPTVEQADTVFATTKQMMRSEAFRRGFEEKRAGKRFRYDEEPLRDDWEYERGRQLATAAPPDMSLMIGRRLNPEAIALFEKLGLGW